MSESVASIGPADPDSVKIRAEPSLADPGSCRFVVSRTVYPGGPFYFPSPEKGRGSPLIERLFAIDGVASVLVADNVVTVGRNTNIAWTALLKPIGAAIRAQLVSGAPCILERPPQVQSGDETDSERAERVQGLINREINPSIASHGGSISVERVEGDVLYVRMSGGCQGCAASAVTLRQSVEVMLRRAAPEIRELVDLTDHSAGSAPYYRPSV